MFRTLRTKKDADLRLQGVQEYKNKTLNIKEAYRVVMELYPSHSYQIMSRISDGKRVFELVGLVQQLIW